MVVPFFLDDRWCVAVVVAVVAVAVDGVVDVAVVVCLL